MKETTDQAAEDELRFRQLESALRQSEAGLRHAQEVARLAHVITRSDGSFESWSPSLPGLIGADEATLPRTTRAWLGLIHPEDREAFRARAIAAGARQERTQVEYRLFRGGQVRHILQVMEPDREGPDGRMCWFSTLQDITSRKEAEEQVRRLNADLERRVAERTAELEAANQELEAFDYSISHDLRAPLSRIEGFTSILIEQHGARLEPRGLELLQRIAKAAAHMNQLVEDLFALSTTARGELNRTEVDVGGVAAAIFASLRKAEPLRNVRLEVVNGITARADPGLLRVVLENLLGNAWKFTRERSEALIEVGSLPGRGERIFFVRDNGAGFDSSAAGKLFTPFQRLHAQDQFEGTGIGLATVQRIVRRHGGRVWAQAEPGLGASFFFSLPGQDAGNP